MTWEEYVEQANAQELMSAYKELVQRKTRKEMNQQVTA